MYVVGTGLVSVGAPLWLEQQSRAEPKLEVNMNTSSHGGPAKVFLLYFALDSTFILKYRYIYKRIMCQIQCKLSDYIVHKKRFSVKKKHCWIVTVNYEVIIAVPYNILII